jgi:hypothetical protein
LLRCFKGKKPEPSLIVSIVGFLRADRMLMRNFVSGMVPDRLTMD